MSLRFTLVILLIAFVEYFVAKADAAPRKGRIDSFAGPFKLILKKVEFCPPEIRGKHLIRLSGTVKQTRQFPEPLFYGNLETLEPYNNDLNLHIAVSSWNTVVGWIPNALHIDLGKACDALYTIFKDTMTSMEAHDTNHQKICPRGKGNSTFAEVPTIYDMGKFVAFPYGKFRADATFHRGKETHGCIRTEVDIVPVMV